MRIALGCELEQHTRHTGAMAIGEQVAVQGQYSQECDTVAQGLWEGIPGQADEGALCRLGSWGTASLGAVRFPQAPNVRSRCSAPHLPCCVCGLSLR